MLGGPTGVGKSAAALELAVGLEREGVSAILVSADSRQIFRGFDIGTDKVAATVREAYPHVGIDVTEADNPYTLYDWLATVRAALDGASGLAIVVGGTGLYQRGLLRGFLPGGSRPSDPAVRARLEEQFAAGGREPLDLQLRALNPAAAAATVTASPRRLVRTLEIAVLGGDPLARDESPWPAPWHYALLDQPDHGRHREALAARIERQFADGLVDEAVRLAARLLPGTPALSGIGYGEALRLHAGEIDATRARHEAFSRTWAYARRQRTWYRAEPIGTVLAAGEEGKGLVAIARSLLEQAR